MKIPLKYILLVFVEGIVIMSIELLGSRIIAPFFGSSLDVWTFILALVLAAVATGYFLGGRLSTKKDKDKLLVFIFLFLSFWIGILPFLSEEIMILTTQMGIFSSLVLSSILIFFIPSFVASMIIPIVIQVLSNNKKQAGKISGLLYFISTFGGIISTLFLGFYIIQSYGIKGPLIFLSTLLLIISMYIINWKADKVLFSIFVGLYILVFSISKSYSHSSEKSSYNLIYQNEGLLGQFRIFDFKGHMGNQRLLTINNIPQNSIVNDTVINESMYNFVHTISSFSRLKPKISSTLILGMGGGSLAQEFINHEFTVDAVDIDNRYWEISQKYFNLSHKVNFFTDDARHFINVCKKKYDIVLIDVTIGEITPSHVFTSQSFKKIYEMLNDNGILFINYSWYINGEEGVSSRSIYKTLNSSGFYTYLNFQNPNDFSDIIFIGLKQKVYFSETKTFIPQNECCKKYFERTNKNLVEKLPFAEPIFLIGDEIIFDDNLSSIERMKSKYLLQNRQRTKLVVKDDFLNGIPIFH